jgi:hypothetical protein
MTCAAKFSDEEILFSLVKTESDVDDKDSAGCVEESNVVPVDGYHANGVKSEIFLEKS